MRRSSKRISDAKIDQIRADTALSNEALTEKRRQRENMEGMGMIGFTTPKPVYAQPTINPIKRG